MFNATYQIYSKLISPADKFGFSFKRSNYRPNSFSLVGDHEKAIAAGCNDSITKPIRKDMLTSLIQRIFKS